MNKHDVFQSWFRERNIEDVEALNPKLQARLLTAINELTDAVREMK